ncbi:MAG: XRE family transcriptional regulator [Faecalibacterium sp.]|nr:XRE family transcriptional regulator [Ruminococcus sp.]MCM1392213.1 XRE family transcriptional regulator [Ruminococcus sp.]MCM1485910.1 XRE family transcriptional regulator [Faecalibacterium sp.]
MNELNIGQKLKTVRQKRNLTLDETAALTGVSKPMLGQIERGQSSPTITTLWKIATGLKVPLSSFLQEEKTNYSIACVSDENAVSAENGTMRAYTLFSYDPIRNFEAFYIEFDPGCIHTSDKHNDNVEETVYVISGRLDMVINGEKITLEEKQAIRFSANVTHSYQNNYSEPCIVYNTIFY